MNWKDTSHNFIREVLFHFSYISDLSLICILVCHKENIDFVTCIEMMKKKNQNISVLTNYNEVADENVNVFDAKSIGNTN